MRIISHNLFFPDVDQDGVIYTELLSGLNLTQGFVAMQAGWIFIMKLLIFIFLVVNKKDQNNALVHLLILSDFSTLCVALKNPKPACFWRHKNILKTSKKKKPHKQKIGHLFGSFFTLDTLRRLFSNDWSSCTKTNMDSNCQLALLIQYAVQFELKKAKRGGKKAQSLGEILDGEHGLYTVAYKLKLSEMKLTSG